MGYFERNRKWLTPLFAILIFSISPMVLDSFNDPGGQGGGASLTPQWMKTLSLVGLVLAGFAGGLGALLTNTLSARILQAVLPMLALGFGLTFGDPVIRTLCALMAIAYVVAWFRTRSAGTSPS